MKRIAFAALAAAFTLAACDATPNDDTATAETGAGVTDTTVAAPVPTATETTVVTTPGATTTATSTGDKVTVGPNGVTADVGSGDTRVKVNTDNPTLTVEKH